MDGYCTCGARLPEDARFCHKCGKPQYDPPEPAPEDELGLEPVTVVSAEPPQPPGISFRNPLAVRTGILVAVLISFLMALPMPSVFQALWQFLSLLAGGFFSVYLYHRRSGTTLSIRSGARLGWITGVFCFLIMMILFTISILAIATGEGLQSFFRQAVSARGTPELADQLSQLLENPAGVAGLLLGFLVVFFFMLTVLSTLGGALGAKVLEKE